MEKLCYVVITRVSDFIASIDHAVRHMKRPAARNRDHPQLVQKLVFYGQGVATVRSRST